MKRCKKKFLKRLNDGWEQSELRAKHPFQMYLQEDVQARQETHLKTNRLAHEAALERKRLKGVE